MPADDRLPSAVRTAAACAAVECVGTLLAYDRAMELLCTALAAPRGDVNTRLVDGLVACFSRVSVMQGYVAAATAADPSPAKAEALVARFGDVVACLTRTCCGVLACGRAAGIGARLAAPTHDACDAGEATSRAAALTAVVALWCRAFVSNPTVASQPFAPLILRGLLRCVFEHVREVVGVVLGEVNGDGLVDTDAIERLVVALLHHSLVGTFLPAWLPCLGTLPADLMLAATADAAVMREIVQCARAVSDLEMRLRRLGCGDGGVREMVEVVTKTLVRDSPHPYRVRDPSRSANPSCVFTCELRRFPGCGAEQHVRVRDDRGAGRHELLGALRPTIANGARVRLPCVLPRLVAPRALWPPSLLGLHLPWRALATAADHQRAVVRAALPV
jgi:hypothetical protein